MTWIDVRVDDKLPRIYYIALIIYSVNEYGIYMVAKADNDKT